MPFLAPDIGIDLGTENINVYVRGRGIVISEPTLVVLDRENRHTVRAVGDEARFLYGRTPDQPLDEPEISADGREESGLQGGAAHEGDSRRRYQWEA